MKLLFVENRYATRLLAAVARVLQADGHSVHWIVQNPGFAQTFGTVHVIPFPRARRPSSAGDWTGVFARIAATDRQIMYFGSDSSHYQHYANQIARVVDAVRPEIVFGESTQFYELLIIESCRRRGIPYLFPVSMAFPRGRMCFYAYDTRVPVGGDGSRLDRVSGANLIAAVNSRAVSPTYMTGPSISPLMRRAIGISNLARVMGGWMAGEHFSTPSPLRKLIVDRRHSMARRSWDRLAATRRSDGNPYVLYALQVQPECAIDVWGWPWQNQTDVIERTGKALARRGMSLVVKPNPRPMYEISGALLDVVSRVPNIIPIMQDVPMRDVFSKSVAVVGVTGSVLLEAVFAGKPSFSLGRHVLSHYPGIRQIESPEELTSALDTAVTGGSAATSDSAFELLDWLNSVSYPGDVFEPLFNRAMLFDRLAINRLTAAFRDVIARLATGSIAVDPMIGHSMVSGDSGSAMAVVFEGPSK